jgi:aspartate/methionine/tyrosine aminotransferase
VLRRSRAIVEANLPVLDDFIARNERFSWVRPQAGTIGLIELDGGDVEALAREVADTEGVMILPASVFDWPANAFRVGYARAGMPQALERFERFIQQSGLS